MAIFVVGVNHKTASVALREQIFFAPDQLPLYLQDLFATGFTKEAVLLSTCNRSELYCETDEYQNIRDWFAQQTTTDSNRERIARAIYDYRDEHAIEHMMAVACGLDSMVLGEPQILGQLKTAFSESCAANAVGPAFHRLFQHIFTLAKEIRTTTTIGACPVSMVSAAVHFAKSQCKDFSNAKVVVIGGGETAQLLMRYLKDLLQTPIAVVSRTPEKISQWLKDYRATAYGMDALSLQINKADIIFSMTGSAIPIITYDMMKKLMAGRKRSLTLIDIAVPRDIDPAVATIANTQLYCIDDLKSLIEANRMGRMHAAEKARDLISAQSNKVIAEYQSFDYVASIIRAYRKQIEDICGREILKAQQELAKGNNPTMVLEDFAKDYTNKLLHIPSVQLRKAGTEGKFELLRYVKQLFAIPDLDPNEMSNWLSKDECA